MARVIVSVRVKVRVIARDMVMVRVTVRWGNNISTHYTSVTLTHNWSV